MSSPGNPPLDAAGWSDSWPAPAKLNLFLHVTGRRDDGYHLLQTVFQFIDYQDEIIFRPSSDPAIRGTGLVSGIAPGADLTIRAARLLQSVTGVAQGAEIRLQKRLPVAGGLGGGSSDAATTLVALNALWRTGLTTDELAALGLELGADVPVFVRGHAAWGEGVGEKLRPVVLSEPWFLIVSPNVRVSTAGIFSDPELTRDTSPITIADFLAGGGKNDCEPVVRRRYPAVAESLDWLDTFAPARMTGTGGCVFAAFDARESAARALDALPGDWRGFVARGRNRSPLLDRCA